MKSHKHLTAFDPHGLLISATRYWMGRCTIGAGCFAQELAKAWPTIPEKTRTIIRRDLEEAFSRDAKAREEGRNWRPLGMDCDRREWERVREAWVREDDS